jgi:hypothetical protein
VWRPFVGMSFMPRATVPTTLKPRCSGGCTGGHGGCMRPPTHTAPTSSLLLRTSPRGRAPLPLTMTLRHALLPCTTSPPPPHLFHLFPPLPTTPSMCDAPLPPSLCLPAVACQMPADAPSSGHAPAVLPSQPRPHGSSSRPGRPFSPSPLSPAHGGQTHAAAQRRCILPCHLFCRSRPAEMTQCRGVSRLGCTRLRLPRRSRQQAGHSRTPLQRETPPSCSAARFILPLFASNDK